MIATSNEYKTVVAKSGRTFYPKVVIDGKEYTSLYDFKIVSGVNSSSVITFGDTMASYLECTIIGVSNTNQLVNKQAIAYIGLQLSNSIEWIKMGTYTVSSTTRDDKNIKIHADDNIIKLEQGFFTDLKGDQSLTAIITEQCSKVGIKFLGGADNIYANIDKLLGLTLREVIGQLSSLCGKNAVMDRNGNLKFVWYTDIGLDIKANRFADPLNMFETDTFINKVTCTVSDDTKLSIGTGVGIDFANPLMTEAQLQVIYNRIKGFTYRACDLQFTIGQPDIDAGDIVKVIDKRGTAYSVPIMTITCECDGGVWQTIKSVAKTDTETTFSQSGPITRQVERVYSDLTITKQLIADTIIANNGKFENIETNYLTVNKKLIAQEGEFIKLSADYAEFNKAVVNDLSAIKGDILTLTTVDLTAIKADISQAKIGIAEIGTLISGSVSAGSTQTIVLNAKNTTIENALIKSAMIDTLVASKITAGIIDASSIHFKSKTGNMDIYDNTISIRDANRVRVQIGKDASSDYNMYVWDNTGKLMFDATGLKADGIKGKIIRDDMVSDSANINGSKLNIASVVTGINNGTSSIKSSQILYDPTGQTLNVAFNSLSTKLDDIDIGERNLYKLTRNFKDTTSFILGLGSGSSGTIEASNGTMVINKIAQGAYFYLVKTLCTIPRYEAGKQYTLTLRLKSTFDGAIVNASIRYGNGLGCAGVFGDFKCTTEYQTISKTMTAIEGKSIELYLSFNAVAKYYIEWIKVTEGNMATDWSPAPEEVEDKIVALSTSLTVEQGKISGLISESTQIKGDVSSLNTKYTSIEATVKGLDVKVGEQTTSLSTVTNTVSANKANWDKAGNALATAESAKNSIDGLKIGGRNLAQKTTSSFSTPFSSFTGILNECRTLAVVLTDGLQIGDSISIRLIYKYTNIVATAGQTAKFLIQGYGETTGYARGWFPQSKQYTIVGSGEVEIEYQATINAAHLENTKWVANIRHDNIQSGAVQWKMFKVEKGNQYSDWTPAPEDTENLITTEIKTVTDKQASFDVTLDGIKGRVSSTESKITTVTETVNGLQVGGRNLILNSDTLSKYTSMFQTYRAIVTEVGDLSALSKKHTEFKCTTAGAGFWLNVFRKTTDHVGKKYTWSFWAKCSVNKSGSIGHESGGMKVVSITTEWQQFTHTWTMSNHAYTSFIFYLNYLVDEILYIRDFIIVEGDKAPSWVPAPEDIENRITTEIKTVTDKQASLDVTLNGISGRVSSTESRVATVSESLNNLQVGGTNQIKSSDFYITQTGTEHISTANDVYDLAALMDKYVTLSIEVSGSDVKPIVGREQRYGAHLALSWKNKSGSVKETYPLVCFATKDMEQKRLSGKVKIIREEGYELVGFRISTQIWVTGNVKVGRPKLEIGTMATDWSPAPQDIDSRITTEIKTVTDKQALFDVTLSGITGRVLSTETNVTTITNNFNNLQVGSSNIFKTSGQFTDIASLKGNWSSQGGGLSISSTIQYLGNNTIQTNVGQGISGQWYKLETGVEYTFAVMMRSTKVFNGSGGRPVHYWTGIDNVQSGSSTVTGRDDSYVVPNTWKLLYVTFKLIGNVNSFRPFIYASPDDFGTWNIAFMTLTKGNKPLIDWSPAPEEVTGSITETKTKLADLSLNYDGFKTTVSETYTTKNDFNNLQVGVNNLMLNTAPRDLTGWVSWVIARGTTAMVDESTAFSGKAVKVTITTADNSLCGFYRIPKRVAEPNKSYAWSCWLKASRSLSMTIGNERGGTKICAVTSSWQKFTHTFTANNNRDSTFIFYANYKVGDIVHIHSLIMVEGTKTPDWCEAPEDLNGIVTGIQTNVSTINQTVSGISLTVEKKVDKTSIISSINQTAEAIKISASKLELTGAVTISMLENSLKNTVNTAKDDSYKAFIMARAMAQGRMLYTDPTFLRGYNNLTAYNNAGNSNVSLARAGRHAAIADCPSPYYIEVQSKGYANPGWGGFFFGNQTSANHTYVYKIVAKIPSDRWISWAANASGDGSSMMWLTSQDGTGKFEEYICMAKAGSSGTFSSIGFFYLDGGTAAKYWWLGYATCWDLNTEPLENEWTQGTTKINGGFIQTGTITADKLLVNDLSALNATIAGWTINANSLSRSLTQYINYTSNDYETVKSWILSGNSFTTTPPANMTYLDVDCNGVITSSDYVRIKNALDSGINYINGSVSIDTNDLRETIKIKASSGLAVYPGYRYTRVGAFSVGAQSLAAYDTLTSVGYTWLNDLSVVGNAYIGTYGKSQEIQISANTCQILALSGISFMSGANTLWYEAYSGSAMSFRPASASSGSIYLGMSYSKWATVYASSGSINTSDRTKKHDIYSIDDRYKKLFLDLKPVSYKFNDGASKRTHLGYISQDVETSLYKLGMDGLDFAGFCKDQAVTVTTDKDGKETMTPKFENGKPVYDYSLRYEEFISLNTAMIQDTIKSVNDLRAYVDNKTTIANIMQKQDLQQLQQKLEREITELKFRIRLLEGH